MESHFVILHCFWFFWGVFCRLIGQARKFPSISVSKIKVLNFHLAHFTNGNGIIIPKQKLGGKQWSCLYLATPFSSTSSHNSWIAFLKIILCIFLNRILYIIPAISDNWHRNITYGLGYILRTLYNLTIPSSNEHLSSNFTFIYILFIQGLWSGL